MFATARALGLSVCIFLATYYTGSYIGPLASAVILGLAVGIAMPPVRAGAICGAAMTCGWILQAVVHIDGGTSYNEAAVLDVYRSAVEGYGWTTALTTVPLGAGVAEVCARYARSRSSRAALGVAIYLLLSLSFGGCFLSFSQATERMLDTEPAPKSYRHDALENLKTVYLMKAGHGYYSAYAEAIREDGRDFSSFAGMSLRCPLFYYAWSALPRPGDLLDFGFAAALLVAGICGTVLAREDRWLGATLACALVYACLLFSFFAGWACYVETWAGLALLLAYVAGSRGRWKLSCCLGLVGGVLRELSALYLVVEIALAAQRRDRRRALAWSVCLLLCLLFHWVNYHLSRETMQGLSFSSTAVKRFHPSFFGLWTIWRFGTIAICLRDLVCPLLILACAGGAALRRDEVGLRSSALAIVYSLALGAVSGEFSGYYAFNILGVLLVGACFVLDAPTRGRCSDGSEFASGHES